jgi:hypothetical protein
VQVIAVVPHHDQAEISNRCVHGGPGTDHDRASSSRSGFQNLEPASVALAGAQLGSEHDGVEISGLHLCRQQLDIAVIGDDDDRVTVTVDCRFDHVDEVDHPLGLPVTDGRQSTPSGSG